MKKFITQVILLLAVIGVGIIFFIPGKNPSNFEMPFIPSQPKFVSVQIGSTFFKAEVVDTPTKRNKGLGGRESLAENEGMLFIFEKADKHAFWMKGMKFPLDLVWIRNNKIVDISENASPPVNGQSDSTLPIYAPKEDVDKVLEIQAGAVKRLNIKAGDEVTIK